MSYEIPQQLEYKEKIIFNLTASQLGYLFLFGSLALIIYLKTPLNFYLRATLSGTLSLLAAGFMFFNLREHSKNLYIWLRNRKIEDPPKLKAFLGIKEVKNNFIIRSDSKKLAVIRVEPINFSIKTQETRKAIVSMFQKFLNSLDFPVQIAMYTESLDLSEHFSTLDKKIDTKFKDLYKNYQEHLGSITTSHQVTNRGFYLVIPEKTDLIIQLELCKKKLGSLGLKGHILENKELENLIKQYFEIKNNKTVPKSLVQQPSFLMIDKTYTKTIHAHGYPRNVEMGFLDKIVSLTGNFDFSLHIEPYEIETMLILLNRELQKQRADLYSAQLKGIVNPSLEIKYSDTKSILENLQKGKEKLFNVSLYITCRAQSKKELDLIVKKVESELNSILIIPKSPMFLMAKGFKACSPLAQNELGVYRNVTTSALSAFFPFTSSFLSADLEGIWFGLNKNNIPIVKDIFKLSNPNGLCLASSGSGKSYLAKLLISRQLLSGTKVMIIDPQGEYRELIKKFDGQRIDLSRESKTIINPFDLMGHDYPEKRLALMDLMPIMLGDLTEPQKALLDRAITEAYERKGIFMDAPETWNNIPPKVEDLMNILETTVKKASSLEKPTITSLINRLNLYVNGVFSFLNNQTSIDFHNNLVCFDIGNLPKQIKPVMMFLVLDYIYTKMKRDLERKLLVIDEAWSLLSRTEDASYIFEIVKTCRKFNLALFLINQEVEGMLSSEAGKSVLANSSYTLLLRQKPAVIKGVQHTFSLSSTEKNFLVTAAVGEGILLMDDEHSEIKIVASPEEHRYITTKPDELLDQKPKEEVPRQKEKPKKINISVDETNRLHILSNLSESDAKYLLSKKFKPTSQIDLSGKRTNCLIKPRSNEAIEHCFLTYHLADYLKKVSKKIDLFETVKPDIIFEYKNKEYAIEVESGSLYNKVRTQLKEKVTKLNKNYGNRWFFVVTNEKIASKYRKLGKTFTRKNFRTQFPKWLKKT